jgi:hypothetical protein
MRMAYMSGSRQTKIKAALITFFTLGKRKLIATLFSGVVQRSVVYPVPRFTGEGNLPQTDRSAMGQLNMLTFWKKAWRPVVVSVNNGAPVEVGCL